MRRAAKYRAVASGSVTLYFVGKRPAEPVPTHWSQYANAGRAEGHERYWLDEPTREVVFLTSNPYDVTYFHGRDGNLYRYRVPRFDRVFFKDPDTLPRLEEAGLLRWVR